MTLFFATLLTGCLSPTQSILSTQITDEAGNAIPNATVEVRDEFAEVYSAAEADGEGIVSLELPPLQTFFAVVSADAYSAASFTGFSGEGEFSMASGTLWLRTPDDISNQIVDFSDCSPSTEGLVDGQVRMAIPGQENDAMPIVTTATVYLIDKDDNFTPACYVPDANSSTETAQTGETGYYAFFDVPKGLYILRTEVSIDGVETHQMDYVIYMPENGTVPLYPTLIPL